MRRSGKTTGSHSARARHESGCVDLGRITHAFRRAGRLTHVDTHEDKMNRVILEHAQLDDGKRTDSSSVAGGPPL